MLAFQLSTPFPFRCFFIYIKLLSAEREGVHLRNTYYIVVHTAFRQVIQEVSGTALSVQYQADVFGGAPSPHLASQQILVTDKRDEGTAHWALSLFVGTT